MCNFLDSSQTFLGVLLTLNVLCIFAFKNDSENDSENVSEINENNFILRFLHYYKEKFRKELIKLENLVKKETETLRESSDYRKLKAISNGNDKFDADIKTEAMLLDVKYSLYLTNSNSIVTDGYVELNSIEASNEQQRAPLFTLAFGLVFFFVDELVNLYQEDIYADSIMFGWWFLIISSIYWFVIWIFFLCRKNFVGIEVMRKSFWNSIDKHVNPILGGLIKIVVCLAIFFFSILWIPGISDFTFCVILVGLMPISIIGFWREWFCCVKGRYSLTHTMGHLISFGLYAIAITSIIITISNISGNSNVVIVFNNISKLGIFSNIKALRFGIICFSLLNGLILPFVIPYIKLRVRFYFESKKINRGLEDLIRNKEGLSEELGELCKKLVKS